MRKYRLVAKKGEGTFSEVLKAQNVKDGKYHAIKCMKNRFESIDQVNNLREIQALRRLSPHEHVITLEEVLYDQPTGRLALVFELMDANLYELIRGRRHYLNPQLIKSYIWQLMKSLDHMHKKGIFHRDIKPENILIESSTDVGRGLKLADFGSCRGIYSKQPYTEYISTRWYRAPECLLTDGYYGPEMDLWGAGCVMFEITSLYPLFPGSNEIDQVNRIHKVLGTPTPEILTKFRSKGTSHISLDFPPQKGIGIPQLIPHASPECIDLIVKLLKYDASERITAREAMRHPYFRDIKESEQRNPKAAATGTGVEGAANDASPSNNKSQAPGNSNSNSSSSVTGGNSNATAIANANNNKVGQQTGGASMQSKVPGPGGGSTQQMQGPGGQYQATSDYKVQPTTIPKALPSILGKEGTSMGGPTQVPKHMQQQQNFLLKASGQALSKNNSMNGANMSMSGQMAGNPGGVGNSNASSLPPIGGGGMTMTQPPQGGQGGAGAGTIGGVTGQTVRQKANPNQASLRTQQQLQQQQMTQQQQQQQMQPQPGGNAGGLGGSGFQGGTTRRRRKSKTSAQLLANAANQGDNSSVNTGGASTGQPGGMGNFLSYQQGGQGPPGLGQQAPKGYGSYGYKLAGGAGGAMGGNVGAGSISNRLYGAKKV